MEDYKYQIRAREQASKVAEYFSYYFRLKPDSSDADYRKANQLIWEQIGRASCRERVSVLV